MSNNVQPEAHEMQSAATRELHRAIASLQEELGAIDAYRQRADACADAELKALLLHNRNEEIEHAAMLMEWIRRHDAQFDAMLRTHWFRERPIVGVAESADLRRAEGAAVMTFGIESSR